MQNQKVIEQLGYTAKEAKVYLTVLGLGECHISDVASTLKMPRSSVQVIADKLYKDGLLNFYIMRRYKYWVAENPERLIATLEKRKEIIQGALPELMALRKVNSRKRYKDKKLEETLAIFRVIADASTQPVLITNQEIEIKYVNSAWEELFGYMLNEVQGENAKILKSGKTPPEVYSEMWAVLSQKKVFQSDKIIDKHRNGTFFNLLTTILPLERNGHLFYAQILTEIKGKGTAEKLQSQFTGVERRQGDRRGKL